jgi:hypothetical protein
VNTILRHDDVVPCRHQQHGEGLTDTRVVIDHEIWRFEGFEIGTRLEAAPRLML